MTPNKRIFIFIVILIIISIFDILGIIYILENNNVIDTHLYTFSNDIQDNDEVTEPEDEDTTDEASNQPQKEEDAPAESWGEVTEWPEEIPNYFPEFTEGTISTYTLMKKNDRYESAWILSYSNVSASDITNYMSQIEKSSWVLSDPVETEIWTVYTAIKDDYEICFMKNTQDGVTNIELITR